ncbi:gp15 tail sheath stabilizer and completion protein [Acinetobacter phage Acj61]|jgi:hypothetical protein|uniref:Gp15 tail sheath stabilizer and completion protein n=1 Tax=Acinetobacter phage Acj61 TaxID=760732 RepID=E5E4F4_9CAUD|nr:gp15 tail sheath stabilizer and completion protein [Acinetobacter phage Acj61]ADG36138.1 gp15 tail sheath stabilizer and completion protein [Acinetobacter phage Acj61]
MFGYWYNSAMRRYIVMMGDLFSHVQVMRRRDDKIELQRVPITYASKERFVEKLRAITSVNSEMPIAKVETILPRMSLHLVDIVYNAPYKTNIQNRLVRNKPGSIETISQYNPTPVKMIFELGIFTRHQDDMFQIIEQIFPYFQPHFNVKMTELHQNDIKIDRDIRVVLQSTAIDEMIETDNLTRRRLEWTLIFEVNGWIYPPVADIEGEIRTIYLDFFSNEKELSPEGSFESVDFQVDPVDSSREEWEKNRKVITSQSAGKPIPQDPEPPHVREP